MRSVQGRRLRPAVATVFLSLILGGAAGADQIRTLDADLDQEVVAIEGEGDAQVVRTAGASIPLADVKEVRFPAADREARVGPARLFLTTGDEIAGEITGGDDAKVVMKTPSLGQLDVPLDDVRAVAFTGDEAELRRFRKEILPLDVKQDVAIMRSWSRQEGILEKIDAKGIVFATDALGTVPLGTDKVIGARVKPFGKVAEKPAGIRARLDLADGSVLIGKLRGLKGGVLTLDSPLKPGLEVKTSEARNLSFLGGRIVYLSDLAPADVEERAKIISIVFRHREDANVMGNPLRLDGKIYRKGLGVHAFTRLTYKLDGAFARFRATIGLDDEAREQTRGIDGTVRFQVLVDGKPAGTTGENGILLTTRDPSRPIEVDVAGASTLTLIADFGESQDTLARGAWADAYLVRK
jgi:hypothetical protein